MATIFDEIKKNNSASGASSSNKDAKTMMTAIEVSKRSGVPVFFMGNPGCGKTTIVELWAKANGYAVESVIASHYGRDEILGYQVNDPSKDFLVIKEPEWFHRIMDNEAQGIPTLLFCDEVTGAPEEVQTALYEVFFEKKIRGGKYLPKSTILIGAGNYHGNLSTWANVTAPALNRFAIVNMLPGSYDSDLTMLGLEFIKECTQGLSAPELEVPVWANKEWDDSTIAKFCADVQCDFSMLIKKYTDISKAKEQGLLNVRETGVADAFDREDGIPEVYNFMSKRSISNYIKVMKALCEMGITGENLVYQKFVDGLIGLGTNSWSKDGKQAKIAQMKAYHKACYSITSGLLNKFATISANNNVASDKPAPKFEAFNENSVAGKINKFVAPTNVSETKWTKDFTDVLGFTHSVYDPSAAKFLDCLNKNLENGVLQFRADYEAIQLLASVINENKSTVAGLNLYTAVIDEMLKAYEFYYESSKMNIEEAQIA